MTNERKKFINVILTLFLYIKRPYTKIEAYANKAVNVGKSPELIALKINRYTKTITIV